jgi:hypothetical protein
LMTLIAFKRKSQPYRAHRGNSRCVSSFIFIYFTRTRTHGVDEEEGTSDNSPWMRGMGGLRSGNDMIIA